MDFIKPLLQYNLWANQLLLDLLPAHPEREQERELPSSFSSLRLTWFHIWDAENIWFQRLKGHSPDTWPSQQIAEAFVDYAPYLLRNSEDLRDWVDAQNADWMLQRCVYRNMKGKTFHMLNAQVLQHVVNHSSYHRGQVINMMHQLGWSGFPSTDYISWLRGQNSSPANEHRDDSSLRDIYG